MNLDLTDEETVTLLRELDGLIDGDRCFMSQRVKTLKASARSSGRSPCAHHYRRRRSLLRHRERQQGRRR
jgi:hypothetical protein